MSKEIRHTLNKGLLFFLILVVIPIITLMYGIIRVALSVKDLSNNQIGLIALVLCITLLVIYFLCIKTYYHAEYILHKGMLKCKMGLFTTSVDIDQITFIGKGDYPAAGNRPALHLKGLYIKYGSGYSLFVTPKEEEQFIQDLQHLNSKIRIKRDV
ncbi:MAG: PH domain-containing protein [Bacteroidota bacterium]